VVLAGCAPIHGIGEHLFEAYLVVLHQVLVHGVFSGE
jgi:hypothetical protein